MDYKIKYIKYKNKYLNLLYQINQMGGSRLVFETKEEIMKIVKHFLNSNIIDNDVKLSRISNGMGQKLNTIDFNSIVKITINKYDNRFELYLKYDNNDDLLKLIVTKENPKTTKLFDELSGYISMIM